jgi:cytochrome c-type biogenesis protein CcmH/NrfF
MHNMKAIAQIITVFAAALMMAGCQTPGTVISENESPHCPACSTVTTTGPIKGTTMTTEMHCPACKTTYIDQSIGEIEDIQVVHHCDSCGINVKACKQCSKVSS